MSSVTTPMPEIDHDERAVRLALAAGTANLRLQRVREVLDQCTPEDRRRILAALDRPTTEA